MIDARDDRAIQRRCEELAGEAFDEEDYVMQDWVKKHRSDGYWGVSSKVGILREKYITECADLYREQAEQEQREHEAAVNENARGDEGKERTWIT